MKLNDNRNTVYLYYYQMKPFLILKLLMLNRKTNNATYNYNRIILQRISFNVRTTFFVQLFYIPWLLCAKKLINFSMNTYLYRLQLFIYLPLITHVIIILFICISRIKTQVSGSTKPRLYKKWSRNNKIVYTSIDM